MTHASDCPVARHTGTCICGAAEPSTSENPAYHPPAELVIHADGVTPPVCEVAIHVTGTADVDEARRLRDTLSRLLEVIDHVEGQFAAGHPDPGVDR